MAHSKLSVDACVKMVSPPLTYEAAYNVVENVRAENWDTFRVWLLHRGHVSTGDTDNHHPHDCLSITVKTWIKNGQDVTWRHLLLSLHAAGELLLGSALWSYAEPQDDPSLTVEALSAVMSHSFTEGCSWRIFWSGNAYYHSYLGVPECVLSYIADSTVTNRERTLICASYYIDVVPTASWTKVARCLYYYGEMKALKRAEEFLSKDSTLTPEKIVSVFKQLSGRKFYTFFISLGIPSSAITQHIDLYAVAEHYVEVSPWASWSHLHNRLMSIREYTLAKEVKENFFIPALPQLVSVEYGDKTRTSGEEVVFTVYADSQRHLSYQWRHNGKKISNSGSQTLVSGTTSPTLYIVSVQAIHEGSYNCVVTNETGSVESTTAELEVVTLPCISTTPSDQTKLYGDQVEFKINATGKGSLTYQWTKDGVDITPDTHPYIIGATTSTMHIDAVLTRYEGTYTCVVSNEVGSVVSRSAKLFVVSPVISGVTSKFQCQPQDLIPLGPPKVEYIGTCEETISGADEGISIFVPPQSDLNGEQVKILIQSFSPLSRYHVELPPGTKLVSPIYNVCASSKLVGTTAKIEHYADLRSEEDVSAMLILHSSDKRPPYCFAPIDGGIFSKDSNFGIITLNSFSHFAIGTSLGIPERYTLYFIHPLPMLTKDCMYAMFSASYSQDSFKKHLLDEMQELCGESVKLRAKVSNVSIADGSDGFELIPQKDPTEEGYSVFPSSEDSFKIAMSEFCDDEKGCSPPNIIICVEADDSAGTKNLNCTFDVHGVVEKMSFVLRVKGSQPKFNAPDRAEQLKTIITEDDIPHLTSILSPFAGYWKEIGVQIGFKPHNLAAIQGDLELLSQPGCTGYLNNLLLKWKMCGSSESLSMEALESALCNPTVNLNNIAKELRHDLQMCKEGNPPPDRQLPSQKQIVSNKRLSSDFKPLLDSCCHDDASATTRWNLAEIHDKINGDKVVIAILDTGINLHHNAFLQGFKNNRILVANFTEGDNNLAPGAHGTMAAYIAAGDTFVDVPCGVAPKATLLICQVGENNRKYSMSAVIKALQTLKMEKEKGEELHVVSMSFGIPHDENDEDQKTIRELIEQLTNLQVICIASCGNYGLYEDVLFPACLDSVISVGALNVYGRRRESNPPKGVDVYAPGENVPYPSKERAFPQGVLYSSGSSCATPAIAGLIALIVQYAKQHVPKSRRDKYLNVEYLKCTVFGKEMRNEDEDHQDLLEPAEYFKERLRLKLDMDHTDTIEPSQSLPSLPHSDIAPELIKVADKLLKVTKQIESSHFAELANDIAQCLADMAKHASEGSKEQFIEATKLIKQRSDKISEIAREQAKACVDEWITKEFEVVDQIETYSTQLEIIATAYEKDTYIQVPDNETESNSHNTLIHCATNLMGVVSKILFIADTVKLRAPCQNMQGESRCQSNC